jgi:Holliday junction resolvase RusA-like endonuclease
MVAFELPGEPVPQPRPRVTTRGGFAQAYTPRKHPVKPYREAIALAARLSGVKPSSGDVAIGIEFVFARPPSHYTKSGLSSAAKPRPRPDWDNLAKAVCDALLGIAFVDDSQVVRANVSKRYAARGESPYTRVTIAAGADQ